MRLDSGICSLSLDSESGCWILYCFFKIVDRCQVPRFTSKGSAFTASELQHVQASALPELQRLEASEFRIFRASKLQSSKALKSFGSSELRSFRASKFLLRSSCAVEVSATLEASELQSFRASNLQSFEVSVLSKLLEFWILDS